MLDRLARKHRASRPGPGNANYGDEAKTNLGNDRWLSVEEIATYLGVKRDTIYKWIDRKSVQAHKVGSLWKFRKDDVDMWVRSGKASDSAQPQKPR